MPRRDPFSETLAANGIVLLDGALATELERRGCDLNDPLWSAKILLERPEVIRAVHADYFAAGADCATTASYQATFEGFARRGITHADAAGLMRRAVALAVEARDEHWSQYGVVGRPRPFVATSVGPYGAYLADGSEYRGDYALGERALMDFHRPRLAVLADAGGEVLAFETIPTLVEARALVRLLEELPDACAWVSFSARDDARTSRGEPIAECAAEIGGHPQVVAVGVNCTAPQHITPLVEAMHAATDSPIVVYPNSGERYDSATKTWSGTSTCEDFAERAREWIAAGARIIGGCCRTTPAHIAELRGLGGSIPPAPPSSSGAPA